MLPVMFIALNTSLARQGDGGHGAERQRASGGDWPDGVQQRTETHRIGIIKQGQVLAIVIRGFGGDLQ
jgi:hypothetical protein